ncbi:MAG: hypothetical protein PHP65_02125 [Bacilli bacterium]|nr:hypothetical protein [Bacilli bacterium]
MKIGVYQLTANNHQQSLVEDRNNSFLKKIEQNSDIQFCPIEENGFFQYKFNVIFVRTGGTEALFLNIYQRLQGPFYLLTTGEFNSLAASMEILSFLKQKQEHAEIIHGNEQFIVQRLEKLYWDRANYTEIIKAKLGVIGKPSDWLIASLVDYEVVKRKMGISLIDIELSELLENMDQAEISTNSKIKQILQNKFDENTLVKALKLYQGLRMIIDKYELSGLTIRCFDLLSSIQNTSCLGLALLNSDGFIGTCEGDIPAMLSMYILREITGSSGFQANPVQINHDNNEIVFAHCTLPLSMTKKYTLMSHFESGLGVAIKGILPETTVTIFKIAHDLQKCFVSRGVILENLNHTNLCRTQIRIKMEKDVSYFLTEPLGNHHIIVLGDYVNLLEKYFMEL